MNASAIGAVRAAADTAAARQRDFDAKAETAAYERNREEISVPGTGRNAARKALAEILAGGPAPVRRGDEIASGTELAYAKILGDD